MSLIGTTWMGEFAKAGGLDPTPDGLVEDSDFFDGAWGSTVVGDTSYGVPWYVETRVLYYRTDLAKKAGWDKAPTTWDEFSKFAADLKKAGVKYPVSLQPGQTGSWQTVLPFAWSNGAKVTNAGGTEYSIDSPQMTEALDYYKSFFDKGYSQTRMLDPGELENGFAKGTYGSFISGPWHIGLVEDAGLTTDKYARRPAARQGLRSRHVVHRRWRPGRLQGRQEPRRRLEAGALAVRARRPSPSGTTPSRTCPPSRAPGRPATSPTTSSSRSSASSSTAPRRRRPCRPGSRSRPSSTVTSRRP